MTEMRADVLHGTVSSLVPTQRGRERLVQRESAAVSGAPRPQTWGTNGALLELPTHARTEWGMPGRRRRERFLLIVSDTAAGLTAMTVDWRLGLAAGLAVAVSTMVVGLQRTRFSLSVLDDAPRLARAMAWTAAPVLVLASLTGIPTSSAFTAVAVAACALVLGRAVAYTLLRSLRRCGRSVFPAVLVGPGSPELAVRIADHPETGLRVVGTADTAGRVTLARGGSSTVDEMVSRGVTDVVIDPSAGEHETATWIRRLAAGDLGVHLLVPQVGAIPVRGWDDHIWGLPLLRMQSSQRWRRARVAKRLTDIVVAGAALVTLAPLLALVAALVRREVGPGIIFRQQRVGLDGRTFEVLKFRSMRDLPPGATSPWSVAASDRIGPIGRIIRKYSFDELPQLWNVLRGDMSLVGPRPERPEYVMEFSEKYPHYGSRHRAPVGLTGWAAVEGLRGDTSIEHRAYFDNLYVDSWSYWTDIKIMARTVISVVRGTGC